MATFEFPLLDFFSSQNVGVTQVIVLRFLYSIYTLLPDTFIQILGYNYHLDNGGLYFAAPA